MRLVIAGGCGEHGRNCFWVKKGKQVFIVDCGLGSDTKDCYPRLSKKMICSAKYLFLTHSHMDHVGAVPWLMEMGFSGAVVATGSTFSQLPISVSRKLVLEEVCPNGKGRLKGIRVKWGRSGHCPGSVWFEFKTGGRKILFSGDYTEHTKVYKKDLLRDRKADFAVLDCAYGMEKQGYGDACRELISQLANLLESRQLLFFPVPRYGRGLELLKLLQESFPSCVCYGDSHFVRQLEALEKNGEWYRKGKAEFKEVQLYSDRAEKGFVFLSDPQLRTPEAKELADRILVKGGFGVLTGTVEENSYSKELLSQDRAVYLCYPVHLNYLQYLKLIQKNRFKKAIPYHSPEFNCEREYEI